MHFTFPYLSSHGTAGICGVEKQLQPHHLQQVREPYKQGRVPAQVRQMFRLGYVPVLLLRSTPQTQPRTGTVPWYFSHQLHFLLQGVNFVDHRGGGLLTEVLHDANPNVPSRYLRRTLLHLAAAFSEAAVILLFKRFGAELAVNAVDEENNTPLHLACNEKVVLHLLMGGADWSAQNKRGQFPSQTAALAARHVLRTDSPCTLLLE